MKTTSFEMAFIIRGFYDLLRTALEHHAAKGRYDPYAHQGLLLQPRHIGLAQAQPKHLDGYAE